MTLIGSGALESRLTAIGNHQGLLKQLALSVVAEQKRLVPRRTGNLGRSIHIASITENTAQVIASANYAAYTEFGTKAHEIVPIHASSASTSRKAASWTSAVRRRCGMSG